MRVSVRTWGHIPPTVSCVRWPAVTFPACMRTIIPASSCCTECQWPAINSFHVNVRKWQSDSYMARKTLSLAVNTHNYTWTFKKLCLYFSVSCLRPIPNIADTHPPTPTVILAGRRSWTRLSVNKIYSNSQKSSCFPSTEWPFTADKQISVSSSYSGTDGTSITVRVCQRARSLSALTEPLGTQCWVSRWFTGVLKDRN